MVMRKRRQRIQRYTALGIAGISIVATVAVVSYQRFEMNAARLPQEIRKDITFSPFLVSLESEEYKAIDYKLAEPEDNIQLLSYVITSSNEDITISQYPQPPQFTDIPEYKTRFLESIIKQYNSVQTANGTIYLGRQSKVDNKQLAVMMERGLIVLMNPKKELSDQQWREIGEQLEIQRVN